MSTNTQDAWKEIEASARAWRKNNPDFARVIDITKYPQS